MLNCLEGSEISVCEARQQNSAQAHPKRQRQENDEDSQDILFLDDEEVVLQESELERLKFDPKLADMLKSDRLAAIIKRIDASKNSKRALGKEIENNKDFKEFIDTMLKGIGYMTPEGHF